jgi:hypothetical protein
MMQPAGELSPLPRCPIKSDQERKCREKKEIASCRQHRSKRYPIAAALRQAPCGIYSPINCLAVGHECENGVAHL